MIIREIYRTFAVSDKTAIYSRTKTRENEANFQGKQIDWLTDDAHR